MKPLRILPFLFSLCALAFPDTFTGKVVGVTDGDTIEVMHNGKAEKVRLHGIDCPESNQPFGAKAKQFTSVLCYGKEVTVNVIDVDRYGRTVGTVTLPNRRNLSHELVKKGLAWWYKEYAPDDLRLKRYHLEAITNEVGLWSEGVPIPPWEFRKGGSSEQVLTEPAPTGPSEEYSSSVLNVTKTGAKYHRENCRYLSESKIAISQAAVSRKGYEPCKVCKPPLSFLLKRTPSPTRQFQRPVQTFQQPTRQVPVQVETAPVQTSATVYATKTGTKYHRAGCQYLSNSKISLSLSGAKARGLTACSRCSPPK